MLILTLAAAVAMTLATGIPALLFGEIVALAVALAAWLSRLRLPKRRKP